ncbi:hypothetical protein [Micromonospora haikouensis]|uniref:hypothetical protein n=1 Tax=Micromonospora haikouensis TaxID=686309 RepID=UPI00114D3320|nr:hypothetical protein [Micromonospora haikouensis]
MTLGILLAVPGVVSFAGTAAADESCASTTHTASVVRDNFDAVETAVVDSMDGVFNRNDLAAIANDTGRVHASAEVRAAARCLLLDGRLFDQIDGGQPGGNLDGLIGRGNLDVYVQARLCPTPTYSGTVIRDNFDAVETAMVDSRDGLLGRDDLFAIANDSGRIHPPVYVRDAARCLLNDTELFDQIDGVQTRGALDGLIDRNDLNRFIWLRTLGCPGCP